MIVVPSLDPSLSPVWALTRGLWSWLAGIGIFPCCPRGFCLNVGFGLWERRSLGLKGVLLRLGVTRESLRGHPLPLFSLFPLHDILSHACYFKPFVRPVRLMFRLEPLSPLLPAKSRLGLMIIFGYPEEYVRGTVRLAYCVLRSAS